MPLDDTQAITSLFSNGGKPVGQGGASTGSTQPGSPLKYPGTSSTAPKDQIQTFGGSFGEAGAE
jgi:hypothetical protein